MVGEALTGAKLPVRWHRATPQAHRLHTHELAVWVEQHVLGLGLRCGGPPGTPGEHGGSGPGPPPAHTRPSLGSPHSVGSKGGFFQAKIGPVDGQSLSGLPGGVQAEPFEIFHFPLRLIHVHTV